jgi:hypothetical protein
MLKKSKKITFSHKITSLRKSTPTENKNQTKLYQTRSKINFLQQRTASSRQQGFEDVRQRENRVYF